MNHEEDWGFTWYFREGVNVSMSALTQEETWLAQFSIEMLKISMQGTSWRKSRGESQSAWKGLMLEKIKRRHFPWWISA